MKLFREYHKVSATLIALGLLAAGLAWSIPIPQVSGSPLLLSGSRNIYLPAVLNITPPPHSVSRYMYSSTNHSQYYNEGYLEGYASRGNVVVVLDFGEPDYCQGSYGAFLWDAQCLPTSEIAIRVEYFIWGYWDGVNVTSNPNSYLRLAVGVNNCKFKGYVTSAHGQAWANMINDIGDWLNGSIYNSRVLIQGAIDIEEDPDPTKGWSTASAAKAWANGYDGAQRSHPYYNYGTCDHCPYRDHPEWVPLGNYSLNDIWLVSWGIHSAWPLPEIYNTAGVNAYQWQNLSLYSTTQPPYYPMDFIGSLTQHQACIDKGPGSCPGTDNTAEAGWIYLYKALNSNTLTTQVTLPVSTDITWQN